MMRRTIAEIERMLGRRLTEQPGARSAAAEAVLQGVSTDSRTAEPGSLFVPLRGEKFDGHRYVREALDKGAAAVLWEAGHPEPVPQDVPVFLVDDTLAALQELAAAYRKQIKVRVVGITGSNGKTTTKDMIGAVLAQKYSVHKTQGNLNNHIGLPLTLLQLSEDTEIAVVEMGMSGRGEIELLSRIAKPDAAVITIIGESHLEQLGSREEIARAKTEILSGIQDNGLFVYNGESTLIQDVLPEMAKPERLRIVRFGMGQGFDLYPTAVRMEADGTRFTVNNGEPVEYFIPLLGRHNVTNALAAIAVARDMGVSDERIAQGLASLKMTSMRIEKLSAPSGLTVLNDAYNASPTSMSAALKLLGELQGYGRKLAVLGDMLELGPTAEELHRNVGRQVGPETADYVLTFGNLAPEIAKGAAERLPQERVLVFDDKEELSQQLLALVRPDDVVLVKGSRGMRLEQVVQALLADGSKEK